MATKPMPTFQRRDKRLAALGEPVTYWPVQVSVGGTPMTFALHKTESGTYKVSDPVSGGGVMIVDGQYMGIRTSSEGYTLREIRQLAESQLQNLINHGVGPDKFKEVVETARKKAKP